MPTSCSNVPSYLVVFTVSLLMVWSLLFPVFPVRLEIPSRDVVRVIQSFWARTLLGCIVLPTLSHWRQLITVIFPSRDSDELGSFNWKTPHQPSFWFYYLLKTFPESGVSSGVANQAIQGPGTHFHRKGTVFTSLSKIQPQRRHTLATHQTYAQLSLWVQR